MSIKDLIEVTVREAKLDITSGQYRLVLQSGETGRILSMLVGQFEGNAISMGLEEVWTPRPMTHDLAIELIDNLSACVEHVVISDIKDSTFYALLYVRSGNKRIILDTRPSDAIAIAVRLKKPIFISKKLSLKMSDELDEIFEKLQPPDTIH